MTTLSDGLRQSDRVSFRMSVEASWVSLAGTTLTQAAETLLVSRNERQVKPSEVRTCVARTCRFCDPPSSWIESQPEIRDPENGASSPSVEARVIPRRNRTRIKARILACIRRRGFQEEIAVCEDLSKGGLSFRSRNQYAEGTRVEVAVPYTPGAGAIFVPIRIVFSQSIPTAGLYRHAARYIKPT